MLSSAVLSLAVFAFGAVAHGFDWVDTLPDCWQAILKSQGCDSKRCICDASQSDSFLPIVASQILKKCDTDDWKVEASLLFTVQSYCEFTGNPVPDDILDRAYSVDKATASTTTKKADNTQKTQTHKTTKAEDLKSTVTTTLTQTKTDKDGHTLVVIIPIVMGPNTISTGKMVTSTLEPKSTDATSSNPASPSTTAPPLPASTQEQSSLPTSTSPPSGGRVSNSNGSPFENMQAGASRCGISVALFGIGLVGGLFMIL